MPLAEIIREIDACLLFLRQARDLLSVPLTEARRERKPLDKKKVKVRKTALAASSNPRISKKTFRSNPLVRGEKMAEERVDSVSEVRGQKAHQATNPEPPLIAVMASPRTVETGKRPSGEQRPPTLSMRRQTAPRPLGAKARNIKPAGALTNSMSSKIVVLSAEEAKHARERAAHSEVQRPPVHTSGRTGRLAFEALFKD